MRNYKSLSMMALLISSALLTVGCKNEGGPETYKNLNFQARVTRDGKPVRGFATFWVSYEAGGVFKEDFIDDELDVGGRARVSVPLNGTTTGNLDVLDFAESLGTSVSVDGGAETECSIVDAGEDSALDASGKDILNLYVKLDCALDAAASEDHTLEIATIMAENSITEITSSASAMGEKAVSGLKGAKDLALDAWFGTDSSKSTPVSGSAR
jgi:hypothetical protein